jgi:hypothetical protein
MYVKWLGISQKLTAEAQAPLKMKNSCHGLHGFTQKALGAGKVVDNKKALDKKDFTDAKDPCQSVLPVATRAMTKPLPLRQCG